ncbi:uncharacterized protein emp3a isoform 2-T3 [Spinachia spinachia]
MNGCESLTQQLLSRYLLSFVSFVFCFLSCEIICVIKGRIQLLLERVPLADFPRSCCCLCCFKLDKLKKLLSYHLLQRSAFTSPTDWTRVHHPAYSWDRHSTRAGGLAPAGTLYQSFGAQACARTERAQRGDDNNNKREEENKLKTLKGADSKTLKLTGKFPHHQAAMGFLLIFLTMLHLVTLTMLYIATLDKSWWVWDDLEVTDLWYNCFHDNATNTWLCAATSENDWLQSIQALMVLSLVFSSVSFLVFLIQLFTMSKGRLFYFTGLSQAFAGFTTFAACLIFTFHRKDIFSESRDLKKGSFGYCYILAWLCVPLLLVSGVLYLHLRKKQ